ncbi:hypothetical protein U713_04485 [Rhodobacter capsulatus YW2]|nr:hypothetical protein U713_04485 [Rhodobacter capsulatus YW2]
MQSGDLLLAIVGQGSINKCNVFEDQGERKFIFTRALGLLRPKLDQLDSYFLRYFLQSAEGKSSVDAGIGGASGQQVVTTTYLKALPIPLPPLDEQKRIVAVLDEAFERLDRARANAEANLADARELWASVLSKEFAPDRPGFTTQTLNDLAADDCSLSYGIVQPGDELPEGLPIVRPVDLGPDLITLDGLKRIAPDRARGYDRTRLKGGELLLCVRGTTGLTAVASEELAGANVTRGIVPIRFDERRVLSRFAEYQFASPFIQDQIAAKTYGAALMQINIGDLRKIIMAAPDIETQRDTVEKLDAIKQEVDPLSVLMKSRLNDLDDLRQSLLQKAFSGELG